VVPAPSTGQSLLSAMFGRRFRVGEVDLVLLFAASAAHMLAVAIAQALLALRADGRVALAWVAGNVAFLALVALPGGIVHRAATAFVLAEVLTLALMGAFIALRARSDMPLDVRPLLAEISEDSGPRDALSTQT
jgi:O-antigen/teichoic acid export membrane protein